jgi:hypothetical protein
MVARIGVAGFLALLLAACGGGRDVTVIGPDGEPVKGAIVVVNRPGASKHDVWDKPRGKGGSVAIPSGAIHEDSRLVVYAPGCRLVDREMPAGDVTIRLERGIPVRVLLEEGCVIPDPNLTLTVKFDLVERPAGLGRDFAFGLNRCVVEEGYLEMDEFDRREGACRFSASKRTVTLCFPHPGRWRPAVTIMRFEEEIEGSMRTESGSGHGLREGSVPEVFVEDRADIQEVTLFPERHEYQRVLERMRTRK